jgi:hypothetical protein
MEHHAASIPDWRDAAAYSGILGADRAMLAWEWLRRLPGYRTAAALGDQNGAGAQRWGLHRFEDPDRAAPQARPMWTAEALDGVLAATATPAGPSDGTDLAGLSRWLTAARDGQAERLLVSDGWRAVRIDLTQGSALAGPVELRFAVPGPPRLAPQILSLRRLDSFLRTGRFVSTLHRPEPRARRHAHVLRAADALVAGASQREIAAALLDPAAARPCWREDRPDLRLQAQRLMRDARVLHAGGFRSLLGRHA